MAQRYRKVKVNGRSVSEHRWVWEQANGPIPPGYIVHHRNGDKLDNRLENLELLTHAKHSEHHNQKHPRTKRCEVCDVEFTPAATKRARSRTCGTGSDPCARELMRRAAVAREARRRQA